MSLKSDVRIGSQRPLTLNLPNDRHGSAGLEAVDLAAMAGLILDDWQQWSLYEAMSEASNGQWSAFEVAILVSRQNGKGSILEARQLAGLYLTHERLQVHTAHEFKTCFEHFLRVVHLIEGCPELDNKVMRIRRGAGEQAIELKTGERLRFLARSGGSGRGMSGDTVYLDEAFALTPSIMGALLPTLSARPNPQLWYMSSAPKYTSEVLMKLQQRGHEGQSPRLFLADWGQARGVDIADRDAWYESNPALGIRITEEFVEAELAAMEAMPDEFARERLGVPDADPSDQIDVKLPADKWALTWRYCPPRCPETHAHKPLRAEFKPGEITLAYAITPDGTQASIAIGGQSLQNPYVQVIDDRDGSGWLPARMVELVLKWNPIDVGCVGAGPSAAQVGPILQAFTAAGIDANRLTQVPMTDYRANCAGFYTDVIEERLERPAGQGPLDLAVSKAEAQVSGDSWKWDIRNATVPICQLEACTVARALLPVNTLVDLLTQAF